jgi:hypothetical protein
MNAWLVNQEVWVGNVIDMLEGKWRVRVARELEIAHMRARLATMTAAERADWASYVEECEEAEFRESLSRITYAPEDD